MYFNFTPAGHDRESISGLFQFSYHNFAYILRNPPPPPPPPPPPLSLRIHSIHIGIAYPLMRMTKPSLFSAGTLYCLFWRLAFRCRRILSFCVRRNSRTKASGYLNFSFFEPERTYHQAHGIAHRQARETYGHYASHSIMCFNRTSLGTVTLNTHTDMPKRHWCIHTPNGGHLCT